MLSILPILSTVTLSEIFSAIVGGFFLFSGGSKLLYSKAFIIHLERLGILTKQLSALCALVVMQVECALGVALILGAYFPEVIAAALSLIVILSMVTLWGAAKKRIKDCGCYGMVISVTPVKSLLINAALVIILVLAWLSRGEVDEFTPLWKGLVAIGVIILSNVLAKRSLRSPLVDLTPLRPGKPWRMDWIDPERDWRTGSHLMLFLDHPCDICEKWIGIITLDSLAHLGIERIIYVYPGERKNQIARDARLRALENVRYLDSSLYKKLVYLTPTAVLIRNGTIQEKWVNQIPGEAS